MDDALPARARGAATAESGAPGDDPTEPADAGGDPEPAP
jgi:hypothetical protein